MEWVKNTLRNLTLAAALALPSQAKADDPIVPEKLETFTALTYDSNGNGDDSRGVDAFLESEDWRLRLRQRNTAGENTVLGGGRVRVDALNAKTTLSLCGSRLSDASTGLGGGLETNIADGSIIAGGSFEWLLNDGERVSMQNVYVGTDLYDTFLRAGIARLGDNRIAHGVAGYSLTDNLFAAIGGRYVGIPEGEDQRIANGAIVYGDENFGLRLFGRTDFHGNAGANLWLVYEPTFGSGHGRGLMNVSDNGINEVSLVPDITNFLIPFNFQRGKAVLMLDWTRSGDDHTGSAYASYTFDPLVDDFRPHIALGYARNFNDEARNRDALTLHTGFRGYGALVDAYAGVRDGDKPNLGVYFGWDLAELARNLEE